MVSAVASPDLPSMLNVATRRMSPLGRLAGAGPMNDVPEAAPSGIFSEPCQIRIAATIRKKTAIRPGVNRGPQLLGNPGDVLIG
jgi:hypothetical protein